MIAIIDYGIGNLGSVKNALDFLGAESKILPLPQALECDAVILPGVGAFRDAAAALLPYKQQILSYLKSGKPFLGICLGMQILYEQSLENGEYEGLGFFKGTVTKLKGRTPQIGWNRLRIVKDTPVKDTPLLDLPPENLYAYFINSYAPPLGDETIATYNYNSEYPAAIQKDKVFATQFHPEKSGDIGLQILKNFLEAIK